MQLKEPLVGVLDQPDVALPVPLTGGRRFSQGPAKSRPCALLSRLDVMKSYFHWIILGY